jgi:hypothetical protein
VEFNSGEIPMNWETISAILEAVGVIAVVISLLYLALQIRFARLAAADTSRTARSIGVREIDLTMVNNAGLRENWLKSSNLKPIYQEIGSQLNLSVEEALQVDTVCQCWMRLHWGQFKSITTPEDLKDLESLISVFYLSPPMKNCWAESPYGKATYDADFVKFVDDAISKSRK